MEAVRLRRRRLGARDRSRSHSGAALIIHLMVANGEGHDLRLFVCSLISVLLSVLWSVAAVIVGMQSSLVN